MIEETPELQYAALRCVVEGRNLVKASQLELHPDYRSVDVHALGDDLVNQPGHYLYKEDFRSPIMRRSTGAPAGVTLA